MKYCKNCGARRRIYDSRLKKDGSVVRRCECTKCKRKWMTIEVDYWEYMKQKEGDESAELL